MLSVLRVHLPSDIPIVGCELTPYVLLRRPDKTVTTDDVPETAPLDGYFLHYKWFVSMLFFMFLRFNCVFVFVSVYDLISAVCQLGFTLLYCL